MDKICKHCGAKLTELPIETLKTTIVKSFEGYCSKQCRAEAASVEKINKKLDEVVAEIISATNP